MITMITRLPESYVSRIFTFFIAASVAIDWVTSAATADQTRRISLRSSEAQVGNHSYAADISAGGQIVVFESLAAKLVIGDTNGEADVYVRNRPAGITRRVSTSSNGTQANAQSNSPAVSADGRFVAFHSFAHNLVPGDTNDDTDIFVRDRKTGTTERVSVSTTGTQGNGSSYYAAISADGRFVAFQSIASNLVANDTNQTTDIFVHDRATGVTERASVNSKGAQIANWSFSPSISGDGRYVGFQSEGDDLVPNDTNNTSDAFVHDRLTGTTEIVSLSSNGAQGNEMSFAPKLSADGRYAVFGSAASNLVSGDTNSMTDVFVRDRHTEKTERITVNSAGVQGNGSSEYGYDISANGNYVAFSSGSTNLVSGDSNGVEDVFLRDRKMGLTRRISVSSNSVQGNDASYLDSLSADGHHIAFESFASNLVANDTNRREDVFVRDISP